MAKRKRIGVTDAARIIGVSRIRVYQFVADGRLKPVPDDLGRVVLDEAAVKKFSRKPRKPGHPAKKR